MKRKKNPELIETLKLAKKNNFLELGKKLSGSTRQYKKINVGELAKIDEDKIIIVGKILGSGEIKKKIGVYALGFSKQAKEKIKKSGGEFKTILEGLKKDKLEKIKII